MWTPNSHLLTTQLRPNWINLMTTELLYLTWVSVLCLLLWVPYIAGESLTFGSLTPNDYKVPPLRTRPTWINRSHRSHLNLVENLPSFATLILVAHVSNSNTMITSVAAMIFFWSRIAQTIIHFSGIPYLRTLLFLTGWISQLVIAYEIVF
jgi:uncharacterized MAPEG superfamily protein